MPEDMEKVFKDKEKAELQWSERAQYVGNVKYQLAKLAGQSEYSEDTVEKIGERFSGIAEVGALVEGVKSALKLCDSTLKVTGESPPLFSERRQEDLLFKINNTKEAVINLQEVGAIFEAANSFVGALDQAPEDKVSDEMVLEANQQASIARAGIVMATEVLSDPSISLQPVEKQFGGRSAQDLVDQIANKEWALKNPMQAGIKEVQKILSSLGLKRFQVPRRNKPTPPQRTR